MPTHINDFAPEVQLHKKIDELHAKVDALSALHEKVDALLALLNKPAEPPGPNSQP